MESPHLRFRTRRGPLGRFLLHSWHVVLHASTPLAKPLLAPRGWYQRHAYRFPHIPTHHLPRLRSPARAWTGAIPEPPPELRTAARDPPRSTPRGRSGPHGTPPVLLHAPRRGDGRRRAVHVAGGRLQRPPGRPRRPTAAGGATRAATRCGVPPVPGRAHRRAQSQGRRAGHQRRRHRPPRPEVHVRAVRRPQRRRPRRRVHPRAELRLDPADPLGAVRASRAGDLRAAGGPPRRAQRVAAGAGLPGTARGLHRRVDVHPLRRGGRTRPARRQRAAADPAGGLSLPHQRPDHRRPAGVRRSGGLRHRGRLRPLPGVRPALPGRRHSRRPQGAPGRRQGEAEHEAVPAGRHPGRRLLGLHEGLPGADVRPSRRARALRADRDDQGSAHRRARGVRLAARRPALRAGREASRAAGDRAASRFPVRPQPDVCRGQRHQRPSRTDHTRPQPLPGLVQVCRSPVSAVRWAASRSFRPRTMAS